MESWMPYERYQKVGWALPSPPPDLNKFFTTLSQHQKGKLIHNLKWGFPPKKGSMDPEFLEEHIRENGPFLYHSTSAKALPAILKEGLYPQAKHPHEPIEHWDARPGHVYLGTHNYVNGGYFADPIRQRMLQVDLRRLDPSKITADEDHWNARIHDDAGASQTVQRAWKAQMPPQNTWPTDDSMGNWANRVGIGDHPGETEYSLGMGSIAYNGQIPPEAITHLADAQPPPRTSKTDAKHFEAKMFHGNPRGLLRGSPRIPFWMTDHEQEAKDYGGVYDPDDPWALDPQDQGSVHPMSVRFKNPLHLFGPAWGGQPLIDTAQQQGYDGVVVHHPEDMSDPSNPMPKRTWAIALDPGTVVPGHDHDFPYV
jgi:hypothetical protein